MFGRIVVSDRAGLLPRRASLTNERIYGVTFLKTELFLPNPKREDACRRAVEKAARRMKKLGFFCAVTPSGFPFEQSLGRCGITTISTVGLCRAMAAPMALMALAEEKIVPSKATAALVAARVTPVIERAAIHLSLRVRHLAVEIPAGGGALCRMLRQEYGVAAMEGIMGLESADVMILFSPIQEEILPGRGPILYLDDGAPPAQSAGRIITNGRFSLKEGPALPPGSDETQLLAALYECKVVSPNQIEILELS